MTAAIAHTAVARAGTHPAWHFAVVAAGAIVIFIGINISERWREIWRPSREGAALAAASAAVAALHVFVAPTHFREAALFGWFFVLVAAFQAGWAVAALGGRPRSLLLVGAAINGGIIVIWVTTRTIGLPLGPEQWQAERVGIFDALATLIEAVIVIVSLRTVRLTSGAALRRPDVVGHST